MGHGRLPSPVHPGQQRVPSVPWKRVQTKRLDAEGNPVDKYDYVVYNIPGVKEFLAKIRASSPRPYETSVQIFTPVKTSDLMLQFVFEGERGRRALEATNALKKRKPLMQDAMDLIVDSDALSAADLRKGFSNNIDALPGEMQMRNESLEENLNRMNYQVADNIDYIDGDGTSSNRRTVLPTEPKPTT